MDQSKKRLWIREPLTREEGASGQKYYSEGDIKSILRTFKSRSDLDRDEFARDLELAASWFVNSSAADKAKPPSTLQREWERRARKIEELLADFAQMGGWERADLEYAAHALTRRTGELPDLPPVTLELPPLPGEEPSPSEYTTFWPVTEQIEKSLATLKWLRDCMSEAGSQFASEKGKPGNRPITQKHDFFHALIYLYNEEATAPDEPRKDRANREYHGESLDFLEACLQPLGVHDSREVIHDTYYRIFEYLHRTRVKEPRAETAV